MTKTHYGPYIKELRTARAWSQEQLAQVSDLSVRTIQRIENGEPASFETLKSIASAFDLDVSEVLEAKFAKHAVFCCLNRHVVLTDEGRRFLP